MTRPTPVPCRDCHHPIWREPYRSRQRGPVCGGYIPTPRRPSLPSRVSPEVDDGQMELFLVVIVR